MELISVTKWIYKIGSCAIVIYFFFMSSLPPAMIWHQTKNTSNSGTYESLYYLLPDPG